MRISDKQINDWSPALGSLLIATVLAAVVVLTGAPIWVGVLTLAVTYWVVLKSD